MATAFSAAVDGLSVLGLQEALVRRQNEEKTLYATAFTIQLGRSLLTAIILILCAPLAAAWFKEPRLVPVLFVLAGAATITGLENVGIIEFRRALRFDIQFKLLLWPRLFQLVATIAAAIELRSYWALLIGTIVLKVARTALTYIIHPYRPKLQVAGWRELAGFSFWTWATGLASLIWDRCDPFVLGPRLGSQVLGIYLIGGEIALLPMTEVIGPAAEALFAGFSAAQKDGVSSVHQAPRVVATMLLVLIPIIIAISCASGDLVIGLLGVRWHEAQPVIAILTWACICSPFSWVCSVVMVANNHVKANFAANLAVSLIKLVVLIIAIAFTTRIDLIAALAALCVAIESLTFVFVLQRATGVSFHSVRGGLFRILVAGVLTLAVLAWLGIGWKNPVSVGLLPLLHAFYIGLICLAIYTTAIVMTWRISGGAEGPESWLLEISGKRMPFLSRIFSS